MRNRVLQIICLLLGICLGIAAMILKTGLPPGYTSSPFLNGNGMHIPVAILAVCCLIASVHFQRNARRS